MTDPYAEKRNQTALNQLGEHLKRDHPDFYTEKRTQTVLSVILRIECLVSCLIRIALAKIKSESSECLITEARKIVQFDKELGQMGAGLSGWPLPNPSSDLKTFLLGTLQIASGMEAFRGPSDDMTEEGKRLVENHFTLLAEIKKTFVFAIANPHENAEILSRIGNVSIALEKQIEAARPLSLSGYEDPWASSSPTPTTGGKGCLVVLAIIIAPIVGFSCWFLMR